MARRAVPVLLCICRASCLLNPCLDMVMMEYWSSYSNTIVYYGIYTSVTSVSHSRLWCYKLNSWPSWMSFHAWLVHAWMVTSSKCDGYNHQMAGLPLHVYMKHPKNNPRECILLNPQGVRRGVGFLPHSFQKWVMRRLPIVDCIVEIGRKSRSWINCSFYWPILYITLLRFRRLCLTIVRVMYLDMCVCTSLHIQVRTSTKFLTFVH